MEDYTILWIKSKNKVKSDKRLVFYNSILNDFMAVISKMSSGFFVQPVRIDRCSVFQYNMGFSDKWNMCLKNSLGVVHRDRNNGTA